MNNALKAVSTTENELRVGNYIVLFGGKDLTGEFFTHKTHFDSSYTDIGLMYVDFEHGRDSEKAGNTQNNVLGVVDWKSAKIDDKGIFVERVLNRRTQYVKYLEELIEAVEAPPAPLTVPAIKSNLQAFDEAFVTISRTLRSAALA